MGVGRSTLSFLCRDIFIISRMCWCCYCCYCSVPPSFPSTVQFLLSSFFFFLMPSPALPSASLLLFYLLSWLIEVRDQKEGQLSYVCLDYLLFQVQQKLLLASLMSSNCASRVPRFLSCLHFASVRKFPLLSFYLRVKLRFHFLKVFCDHIFKFITSTGVDLNVLAFFH